MLQVEGCVLSRKSRRVATKRSGSVWKGNLRTGQGDVLVTPHPSASNLWERVGAGTLVDRDACRKYAETGRQRLADRIAREKGQR